MNGAVKNSTDLTRKIIYNKKYFVLHFDTAKTWEVYAESAEKACELVGYWLKDCFVKMMVSEVTY
jgi:hypothetical protein